MRELLRQPIRQGDVLLLPMEISQIAGKKLSHLTLAEGEVTGHSHRISEGKAELYERDGILYLRVLSNRATITHEEHKALQIPRGSWMVRIQREYEPQKRKFSAPPLMSEKAASSESLSFQTQRQSATLSQNPVPSPGNFESAQLLALANQIDTKYWDDLISEAERLKKLSSRKAAKPIEQPVPPPRKKTVLKTTELFTPLPSSQNSKPSRLKKLSSRKAAKPIEQPVPPPRKKTVLKTTELFTPLPRSRNSKPSQPLQQSQPSQQGQNFRNWRHVRD